MGAGDGPDLVKIVELDTTSDLTEKALAEALKRAIEEPNDGWADLVVYPSRLKEAVKLAAAHNATKPVPAMRVRVSTQQRMGMDDWKLKTKAIEIRVQWEKPTA